MKTLMSLSPSYSRNSHSGNEESLSWPFNVAEDIGGVFGNGIRFHEDSRAFSCSVDLPGVVAKDVSIWVRGRELSIEAERKTRLGRTHRQESFFRMWTLPQNADSAHIKARLMDGLLTLTIPKGGRKPGIVEIQDSRPNSVEVKDREDCIDCIREKLNKLRKAPVSVWKILIGAPKANFSDSIES